MGTWDRAQAEPTIAARASSTGNEICANARRARRGGCQGRGGRFKRRFTRRPSTERKSPPPNARPNRSCGAASREPRPTRASASSRGPSGTTRLASSARTSWAARSSRRDHQTNGCHQSKAQAINAAVCQAESPAAKWASSWAKMVSRCRLSKSCAKVAGKTKAGRRPPNTAGDMACVDSRTATGRRMERVLLKVATWAVISGSLLAAQRRRNRQAAIRPAAIQHNTTVAPKAQIATSQKEWPAMAAGAAATAYGGARSGSRGSPAAIAGKGASATAMEGEAAAVDAPLASFAFLFGWAGSAVRSAAWAMNGREFAAAAAASMRNLCRASCTTAWPSPLVSSKTRRNTLTVAVRQTVA